MGGYFGGGSNWLQLRQKFVSRCSYLVNRKKILKHTILVGLEANPNASCGRKVSFTNASETGRLRRKSEAMEEKEFQPLRQ